MMIETAAPVTLQLAFLIGAILVAGAIAAWRRPQGWDEMFDELERSRGLSMAMAWIAIIFGALVLVLPGGWTDPLAIAVSAVGLISLAEGLVLIALPDVYLGLVRPLLRQPRAWAAFMLLLGLAFILAGLTGRASV